VGGGGLWLTHCLSGRWPPGCEDPGGVFVWGVSVAAR
jgi:hypothetical protein